MESVRKSNELKVLLMEGYSGSLRANRLHPHTGISYPFTVVTEEALLKLQPSLSDHPKIIAGKVTSDTT